MLPTDLIRVINSYATECDLYLVFPQISRDECIYAMSFEPIDKNLRIDVEFKQMYIKDEDLLSSITKETNKSPIYKLSICAYYNVIIDRLCLPRVRSLVLFDINIRFFPVLDMPQLRILDINSCSIDVIPDIQYPLLEKLYLSGNFLTSLPNFTGIPKLKILEVCYEDDFEELPDFNLPLLIRLVMDNTTIQKLPAFSYLSQLTFLNITEYTGISAPISTLHNLKMLYLNREFTTVPSHIDCPCLKEIRCHKSIFDILPEFEHKNMQVGFFRMYKRCAKYDDPRMNDIRGKMERYLINIFNGGVVYIVSSAFEMITVKFTDNFQQDLEDLGRWFTISKIISTDCIPSKLLSKYNLS